MRRTQQEGYRRIDAYTPYPVAEIDAVLPRRRRQGVAPVTLAGAVLGAVTATFVLGVLFALDYASGKTRYAAAATYHAYLEFRVLLALVFARAGRPLAFTAGGPR